MPDLDWSTGQAVDAVAAVERVIRQTVVGNAHRRAPQDTPLVTGTGLGRSEVDAAPTLWCSAPDCRGPGRDRRRAVREGFDAAGLEIPVPTRAARERPIEAAEA